MRLQVFINEYIVQKSVTIFFFMITCLYCYVVHVIVLPLGESSFFF